MKKENIETSIRIYGYLSREGHPVYYKDLANNSRVDISTEKGIGKLSHSITLLEESGLIKELGVDSYSLI